MDKINVLEKKTTKELIKWKDYCYKFSGEYSPSETGPPYYSIEEIKLELSKREHIPNKQESKKIRQEKAKRGV